MDKEYLHSVWEESLKLLEGETTSTSYRNWMLNLTPFAFRDGTFYLLNPDPYSVTLVSRRYGTIISAALTRVMGQAVVAEIILPQAAEALEPVAAEEVAPLAPPPDPDVGNGVSLLNPKYTFSTFVIGPSNRFAHAAAQAVSVEPAKAYNPLFIYGGVGLGKTHLMQAVGHHVISVNPSARVLYISSENFTNQLVSAIANNTNIEFRSRFRNVDILMIDDIQFITGKMQTQEEFFHTFNTLHESGKQIILSSDKQPREIPKLEDRLRSRFEWGLIADVQRPDYETRIAILRKKAEIENLNVPDAVHQYIAERVESNIRELEGSLTRVIAYASLVGKPVSMELVGEALKDILAMRETKAITCQRIMTTVAEYYGVSMEDLKSKKRNREISVPRQIAMMLTRDLTDLSLPKIGDEFGRDHTTVLHACEKVNLEQMSDEKLRTDLFDLKKRITE